MRQLTPVGALSVVAAMLGLPGRAFDHDLYWHLANGRTIIDGGSFPSPDRFSWSAAGLPVLAYSTPLDSLFYLIWRGGGTAALALLATLLAGLAILPIALLVGRLGGRPIVEAAILLPVALALWPFLGARPQVAAFALFGLLIALTGRPFGWRRAILAGLTLALWANLHGTFPIGFGLIAATVLAWGLAQRWRAAAWALGALALGSGGALLSPNGAALWRGPFKTVSNTYLTYNHDWVSLKPLSPEGAAAGVLILLALGVGLWRPTDPRTLAALGLTLPAIQLARFSPFLVLLLGVVIAERAFARWPRLALPAGNSLQARSVARGTGGAAWSLLAIGILIAGGLAVNTAPTTLAEAPATYPSPRAATDALLACGMPAPVWNDYNWGGYLIWRGEGRYPVGIDGRAETLYPDRVFARYVRVVQGQPGWGAIVQASPAQYAMVTADALAAIGELPGWHPVYRDAGAAIAARDGATWGCARPAAP